MKAEWHKIQDKIPECLESVIGCSLDKAGNLLIGECWYIGNNQFYFFWYRRSCRGSILDGNARF